MSKKTKQFPIRIDEDNLVTFKAAAEARGMEPTKVIRDLMAAYAKAVDKHGPRLIWPAEFAHFAPQSKIINYQEEQDHYLKVAEEDPGYETEPHMFYEDDAGVLHPVPKGYRPGIDGPPLKPAKFTNDLKTPLKSKK